MFLFNLIFIFGKHCRKTLNLNYCKQNGWLRLMLVKGSRSAEQVSTKSQSQDRYGVVHIEVVLSHNSPPWCSVTMPRLRTNPHLREQQHHALVCWVLVLPQGFMNRFLNPYLMLAELDYLLMKGLIIEMWWFWFPFKISKYRLICWYSCKGTLFLASYRWIHKLQECENKLNYKAILLMSFWYLW